MKSVMKNLVLAFVVLALAMSTSAYAKGFYLNASIGQSSIDDIEGVGFDEGTSFSVGAGYFFNEYFGFEASYVDLGDAEDDIIGLVEVSADALVLMAVGQYAVTDMFSVFGKLGMASWDAEMSAPGYESVSDDGTDLTWAVGAMLNFTENFSAYGQYQMFDFDDTDVDNIAIGIQYHF